MTEFNFSALGISTAELEEKIVDKAVETILDRIGYEPDTGADTVENTELCRILQERLAARVQDLVDGVVEEHLMGQAREMIEGVLIKRTNEFGEEKAEPATLQEYIAHRLERFMNEIVNSKGERVYRDDYVRYDRSTRLEYLISEEFGRKFKEVIQELVQQTNSAMIGSLKTSFENILTGLVKNMKIVLK